MSPESLKISPIVSRRRVIPFLLGSLVLVGTACDRGGRIRTSSAVISEQEFQRLDQQRKRLITRPVQKPADAVPFPAATISEVIKIEGTNIQVSLNAIPNGFEIFYSPLGIKQLYQDLNLRPIPTLQLHLLTGAILEVTADTEWQEGNCKFLAPIQYMDALVKYVLPHFPQNDWDEKASSITQEWNNRINAIARHESKHAASHYQINNCRLVSQTPKLQAEIEAMQEEIQGRGKPLVFWFNLKQGELFSKHPLVQTFWQQGR